MPHALVILPNSATESAAIVDTIEQAGYTVSIANTLLAAKQITGYLAPAIVLTAIHLPDGNSISLLQDNPWPKGTPIVLIADAPNVDEALQAMRLGAADYLSAPIDYTHLKSLLERAKDKGTTKKIVDKPIIAHNKEAFHCERFGYLLGESPVMKELYNYIDRVAPTTATVMIVGASGSGKELVAQTLHEKSTRAKGPYIAINCGAIAKDLVSSALFGHEKGSFTGALQSHQGYFEQASGGTIFLDEITETSLDLQVRLLRVLETGKVIPVGGKRQINVDVRVIAATNRDPIEAVKAGVLREDLYYRLTTFPLHVPPLHQRLSDIRLLANYFLHNLNQEYQRNIQIQQSALSCLENYAWPGNVRELKNIIQRAYILADSVITENHIIFGKPLHCTEKLATVNLNVGISLQEAQQRLVEATLEYYDYQPQQAADKLQISLKQLEEYLGKKPPKKLAKNSNVHSAKKVKPITSQPVNNYVASRSNNEVCFIF